MPTSVNFCKRCDTDKWMFCKSLTWSSARIDTQEGVFGLNMVRHSFGRAGTSKRKRVQDLSHP
jgi:hypothetical protein